MGRALTHTIVSTITTLRKYEKNIILQNISGRSGMGRMKTTKKTAMSNWKEPFSPTEEKGTGATGKLQVTHKSKCKHLVNVDLP